MKTVLAVPVVVPGLESVPASELDVVVFTGGPESVPASASSEVMVCVCV
jgi:hypothetical protein